MDIYAGRVSVPGVGEAGEQAGEEEREEAGDTPAPRGKALFTWSIFSVGGGAVSGHDACGPIIVHGVGGGRRQSTPCVGEPGGSQGTLPRFT